jgi:Cu(I)/Ag(I) efflux system membrane fusion protein
VLHHANLSVDTLHKVTAGTRVNEKVQILSGLNSTDTVAANAQYLMDSESFMRINNEK